MSEDFYIHYSGASEPYGTGSRMLRERPRERVDAFLTLLSQLLKSDADPGEKHTCPICDQEIEISFEYYVQLPNELDISSDCRTCNMAVFFKSNKIPTWARAVSLLDLPGFID